MASAAAKKVTKKGAAKTMAPKRGAVKPLQHKRNETPKVAKSSKAAQTHAKASKAAPVAKPVTKAYKAAQGVSKRVSDGVFKEAKPEAAKPHIAHDAESGTDYFTLGSTRLPIDGRDLARTIGAGPYGYGKGILDGWSNDVWKKLLEYLDLPSEPLVRDVAQWPIKRLVQRVYLEHFDSRLLFEQSEKFDLRDRAANTKYVASLEQVKTVLEGQRERAVKNLVGKGFAKKDIAYTPTKALHEKGLSFKGQPQLILDYFRKTKFAAAKCSDIAEAIKDSLKTSQPPERVVYHYLNVWKHQGLLEVSA